MAESTVQQSRSRDLDKLLLKPGNLVAPTFEPGVQLRDDLQEYARILVIGAGGLGCELLKDLALSGFKNLEVIDMDRIEVTNLNRQFLFRLEDVGKPKAEVAAKRVMERVSGVNIVPHFCRIEDKEIDFYKDFIIIVLGLDSIEARSYINAVAHAFQIQGWYVMIASHTWNKALNVVPQKYDSDDNPIEETVKPMVDGGTEGFKGHARVIIPGSTPCFECTIWLFPPQVKFPLCTLAETPRTAAHCIEYAHLIKWDEVHSGKTFDPDDPEHMKWVYTELSFKVCLFNMCSSHVPQAVKRAELFGIQGVTYSLTQGVVKNIIPAIASTNAIISAACTLETLKLASGCSKTLSNYLTYNGVEGLHIKVTEFVKDKDCLVCGPGVLLELDTSVTLQKFIDMLEEHPKLLLSKASVRHRATNLYMQAPPVLEEMTRSNLNLPLFELMGKVPKDIIHVTGTTSKDDKKTSCLRKLCLVFKGADAVTDLDMAVGA
ncbi:hypothetical protein NC653_021981 [Populus alba x Populus x berolinensis]|uniref:NEDD8-activating enzyme E1 catalytic subunit n=1 Tax=Populus alba x Populus x berolinensis TaxID=444605 RepID=A0AAD6VTP9_9ROSI|nr:hypothetical protein NC653_021981 [Populus alba x Populus x berolinensis]